MKYSRGFTILSLLIASVIGIFIAGVAGKVYVDSKMAFEMRSAIAATNENMRFAIDDIRRSIVMAGRGIPSALDGPDLYTTKVDNKVRTFPLLSADGTDGKDKTGTIVEKDSRASSILAVRYAQGPSCINQINETATGKASTIRFYINATSELVCEVTDSANTTTTQPIVSGVVRMRALYGIDDDADGFANRYLTATQAEADDVWPNVVTIRVGLLASSGGFEIPNSLRKKAATTHNLLGLVVTAPDTNRFYKTASTTISLRNLNAIVERQ